LNRKADKDSRGHGGNGVLKDDGNSDPVPYLEARDFEHALILDQDSKLGESE
jgi:hypothetical protein